GRCGVWDWDMVRNHVTWSDRIYEFHGVEPGSFAGTVEAFAALTHPDDRQPVSDAIRRAVNGGGPYQLEFRVVRPGGGPASGGGGSASAGEVRWLGTNGRVVYDEQGRPVRMLGATIDTTDRKRAEEERERLLAEAFRSAAAERAARAEAEAA